ncbi:hypothetical protein Ahy_A03g014692 isoform B [Arachis hypogaea]|uniref:Uncharacterized protein n=1 Tax=Arachis hypogaea TaxID=3818 RepID=A0A445DYC3_ARAHY|nr:hypothetical protein Ahy_A03g014692 isoform B [Arachis hypogaea]
MVFSARSSRAASLAMTTAWNAGLTTAIAAARCIASPVTEVARAPTSSPGVTISRIR